MKVPKWLGVVLAACAVVALGAREARAICGIPSFYGPYFGPPAGHQVALYSPIIPFPPTGIAFFSPLGAAFVDAARDTILDAAVTFPPHFLYILGGGPGAQCGGCTVAPAAIVFAICIAPTNVTVLN